MESNKRGIEELSEDMAYFIGIDIGTQGARAVLLSSEGILIGEKEQTFLLDEHSREEQSPAIWWNACIKILTALLADARKNIDLNAIRSLAVTSTSGTVIPLDKNNEPLHSALMYSDSRAAEVAPECEEAAVRFLGSQKAYTHFNASSGLCKMVWYVRHFPDKVHLIKTWSHAADYITGKLCGEFGISDDTNVLKSGYDIFTGTWPQYLYESLPLKKEWLPRVVPSGISVGRLTAALQREFGLGNSVEVVAGMTDGCASQIASGAVRPGDWNTTIGTTMVIKGVTRKPVLDPEGRLYNHRHSDYIISDSGKPEGFFMPGGAGNTGADWVSLDFKEDLEILSARALNALPSGYIAWPLRTRGERFPIMAPEARGFEPEGLSLQEQFIANMEGVAYLEKYAYRMIEGLSGEKVNAVYTAGGGSKSDVWLKIRSCVLNLPLYKMKHVSGAVGAAILAASKTFYHSLPEAAAALTQVEKVVKPESALSDPYHNLYNEFVNELRKRGYI